MIHPIAARNLPSVKRLHLHDTILVPEPNVTIHIHPAEDPTRIIRTVRSKNRIPTVGLNLLRDWIGNYGAGPSAIALGTDATPAHAQDLQLGAEVYRALITRRIPGPAKMTLQLYVPSVDANGHTLSEAAVYSLTAWQAGEPAAGGGTLFSRTNFTPIVKDSSIALTLLWEFSAANAI